MPEQAFIYEAVRTPRGKQRGGALHSVKPIDLVSGLINSLLARHGSLDPTDINDVILGVVIGYLIVRAKIKGRGIVDALSMLPLAVPGLVMAFGYVAVSLNWPFRQGAPLAEWVDIIGSNPNPFPLLIAAYSIRRLPYVVRSTVAGLQQTSGELEEAARNLGAGPIAALTEAGRKALSSRIVMFPGRWYCAKLESWLVSA